MRIFAYQLKPQKKFPNKGNELTSFWHLGCLAPTVPLEILINHKSKGVTRPQSEQ